MKKKKEQIPVKSDLILYQTEDGKTNIEVRLQDETVWMSQLAMAELFQSTKQNISLHLRNVFNEGELFEKRVVKEYLITAVDGKNYRNNEELKKIESAIERKKKQRHK